MKKGISLIVLVITIIVMIILAAAVVITLNNTGIINRANDAINKTNLRQAEIIAQTIWAEGIQNKRARRSWDARRKASLHAAPVRRKDFCAPFQSAFFLRRTPRRQAEDAREMPCARGSGACAPFQDAASDRIPRRSA